jgi:uncharacterized membrane protein
MSTDKPDSAIDADREQNLEKITRVILISAIIIVSGFIMYNIFKPEEEFVQFSLLNDRLEMGNYPTQIEPGSNVTFYFQVENYYRGETEYCVKIYQGDQNSTVLPNTGIKNAMHIQNITMKLELEEKWLSEPISILFNTIGSNQFIGLELWQKINGEWQFLPNYVLTLRLNVTNSV